LSKNPGELSNNSKQYGDSSPTQILRLKNKPSSEMKSVQSREKP
jgi:hypothetical protein